MLLTRGFGGGAERLLLVAKNREGSSMKKLDLRERRSSIHRLEKWIRSGYSATIAYLFPKPRRQWPDHADLRRRMAPLKTSSAELIRAEREDR